MAACPSCGEANPAHARFCLACGAPLDQAAAPREMRKTVTIIFSDVVDSTPLGERLDAETYRRVISRYFIEVSRVLEHHGGTVEKFIGDAVMAVFGIPVVHEDDALRAVRAAGEMREALAGLNEELRAEYGVELGDPHRASTPARSSPAIRLGGQRLRHGRRGRVAAAAGGGGAGPARS